MNAKIKKINAEYEKNAAKIADLQARQKELDKQRTELENLDIVGMVRSMGMTPEELAALIEASKNGQMAPAMTEKEETGDEEGGIFYLSHLAYHITLLHSIVHRVCWE